jgi:hypothetical protein
MVPSHRILFHPLTDGELRIYLVRMVCRDRSRVRYLDAFPPTAGEWWTWSKEFSPAGILADSNGWSCAGGPTPLWQPGSVEVEPLVAGWGPTRASWRYAGRR